VIVTRLTAAGAAALSFLTVPAWSYAVEFSADYVSRSNGKTARAQLYVKEDRWRLEHRGGVLTDLGYAGVSIVRLDKQVVWLLLSKRRQYLSLPLRPDHLIPLTETMEGETARVLVGEEKLGGHKSRLYDVTVGSGVSAERYYQWVAVEHGLPLRTVSRDRDWSIEYEHVVFSKQADFFFEPPLGYAEWTPPAPSSPPIQAY
jgi:hypothetical protein